MQAGLYPIVLIVNNASYGTIRMHQNAIIRTVYRELICRIQILLGYNIRILWRKVINRSICCGFDRALKPKTGAILDLAVSTEAITPRQSIADSGRVMWVRSCAW